jgi:transcriptional regulator with XRE-family HTH domain
VIAISQPIRYVGKRDRNCKFRIALNNRIGDFMTAAFDNEAFFSTLNAERLSRHMTWKEVAQEAGVQASTLTRMSDGKNPDVNGLAALLAWSGLKAEGFIRQQSGDNAKNFSQAVALLRAVPDLEKQHLDVLVNILMSTYNTLRSKSVGD